MYEIYCKLRDEKGCKDADVSKATGITKSTFSDWKSGRSKPKGEKLRKIADFFEVSVEYLETGKSSTSELTPRDKRDIAKDLDRIMGEIRSGQDGPLYYNGAEIDEASISLLENAIEFALTQAKKENKVKYNPNKNKE